MTAVTASASGQTVRGLARYITGHPANEGKRLSTLLRSASWQLWKRATGKPWDVTAWGQTRVRIFPDSPASSLVIYANGLHDFDEMRFMAAYLRPGDSFIDVGANVGVYTLYARTLVGEVGRVIAIEAAADTCERLRENIALNDFGNVEIVHAAAADQLGFVHLGVAGNDAMRAIDCSGVGERVASVTIDSIVARLDKDAAMAKLDIEGAEVLALRGAQASLEAARIPVIQLEWSPMFERFGSSRDRLAGWLEGFGYRLYRYDTKQHKLVVPASDRERTGLNLLAVSDGHTEHVAKRLVASRERGEA